MLGSATVDDNCLGCDWQPIVPVTIEFPSLEQAHRWYDSEEYRELKELRLAATAGNAVFIDGKEFSF